MSNSISFQINLPIELPAGVKPEDVKINFSLEVGQPVITRVQQNGWNQQQQNVPYDWKEQRRREQELARRNQIAREREEREEIARREREKIELRRREIARREREEINRRLRAIRKAMVKPDYTRHIWGIEGF